MKLRRHVLSLLQALFLCAGPAQTQEQPQLTPEERRLNIESFEQVWRTVYEKHFDPSFGGVDWNAVRAEMRPQIEGARDKPEARAIMRQMISRLKLTHFNIIPSDVYDKLNQPSARGFLDGVTGIDLRVVDGHALVISVDPGSPADLAGVKPGWEVVRIGKDEVPSRLASIAQEFEGKSLRDLVLSDAVVGRMTGSIGNSVTVSFLSGSNQTVQYSLSLVEARGKKFRIGHLPPTHVWINVKTLGSDIGYIVFNGFIDPATVMPVFNEAIKSFMNGPGIIIDLRGNPGGQAEMISGMAGWLIKEKGKYFGAIRMRDNELKLIIRPRPEVYTGSVAILVDGLSVCASEIFAGGLRDLGRARIFGSHTAGAALGGNIERLPNGDGFMYAFANYVTAGGQVIEGNGLIPDVEVHHTREALLQGRDLILESAVNWIRNNK